MIALLILVLSLVGLAIASRYSVDSAVKIAEYFGARESAVGFLMIAVFTSIPELFVGVFSAIDGHPSISLGNIIGSNIADILLVLGAGLVLADRVRINRKKLLRHIDILFLISTIPILLIAKNKLDAMDGLALIVLFVIYSLFVMSRSKSKSTRQIDYSIASWIGVNIGFWGGLALVVISSYYAVESTVNLARIIGVPDWLIALSIIALGTSLPELAVDITAIRKGHIDLAIGDILGSCVANITLVLGTTLAISPVNIHAADFIFPISVLMLTNLWLWYVVSRHRELGKNIGLGMILGYIIFVMVEFLVA